MPLYIDPPVRHLYQYRISYHYTLHLYSIALLCNRIPSHTSAARRRRMCHSIIFDFQLSDTFHSREYRSFTPIVKKTTQSTGNEQLAHQFYHQSSTMPPKTAARGQLLLASIRSSTENLRSPLARVTPILNRRASVLPEDEIHDEDD